MDEIIQPHHQDSDDQKQLNRATDLVDKGDISTAEEILNNLVLRSYKKPLVFHLLGSISYDQGKFSKAIKFFRRALEIDPTFTDSSLGLSIILNDLGQYAAAKKVFEEAKAALHLKSQALDPNLNLKFALKHDELGDLYARHNRWKEALREYEIASSLDLQNVDRQIKKVDCYIKLSDLDSALSGLKKIVFDFPDAVDAEVRLGKLYYDSNQIPEAVASWENVLRKRPNHAQALDYLKLAQSIETVELNNL